MGAPLRAVPTRFPRVRHVRVGTAHATERVATSSIVRRAPLPTLRISFRSIRSPSFDFSSSFSSFLPIRYSLLAFSIRHPDEGMAERRQAPGCCEHPVVHAMTGMRAPCFRRPAFPRSGNARLSALHRGDFAARACARRCPAFPPGSRVDLIRRGGHRDPEDQVSRASRGGLQIRKPDLGTATGLAPHFKTPLESAPHEPG
jgi:hypothetical protein